MKRNRLFWLWLLVPAASCAPPAPPSADETADLIVTGGRVYTLSWEEPALDGTPSSSAPRSAEGWRPDAEAVAVKDGKILYVGTAEEAALYAGETTRTLDVSGATVIPGLIDSHTHVAGLGELESQVSLFGVSTEEEAVQRVVDAASNVPEGEWILARGWDDSDWASRYPTWDLVSEKFPNNPVVMQSLHGFAVWGNPKGLRGRGHRQEHSRTERRAHSERRGREPHGNPPRSRGPPSHRRHPRADTGPVPRLRKGGAREDGAGWVRRDP